jgi:hypothetical protein
MAVVSPKPRSGIIQSQKIIWFRVQDPPASVGRRFRRLRKTQGLLTRFKLYDLDRTSQEFEHWKVSSSAARLLDGGNNSRLLLLGLGLLPLCLGCCRANSLLAS